MRWLTIVLAALTTACGAPDTRTLVTTPGPDNETARGVDVFLVVDLEDELYVQLDSPALEGLVDPKKDVVRVEMLQDIEGWAFRGTLTAEAAHRVHRALGRLGPIELMDGGQRAEEVFFGPPVLVGRVVPHFGEVQELEERGIFIDDEDQGDLRHQYLAGSTTRLMMPVQGEYYDAMSLWARTRSDRTPKVAVFDQGPPDQRGAEVLDVLERLRPWAEATARVDLAYETDGETEPDLYAEEIWGAVPLDLEEQPLGPPWLYVFLHYGETFCGEGPDEARLAGLWAPKAGLDRPAVLMVDQGPLIIEPYLIGDLDGDGAVEIIGVTNELTGQIQLLRIKDGAFEVLKSTEVDYRDCPC